VSSIAVAHERPRALLGAPAAVVIAIAAGWALAVGAELSGHGAIHHGGVAGDAPAWVGLGLFLLAWQVMIAAMMLPSTLPLIRLFVVASRGQSRPALVLTAFLGGYALVWSAFGALAFIGDAGLWRAVEGVPWLHERPLLIAGGALALAGAFQFSGLKDRCLSKCRQPGPYLMAHYGRGLRRAVRLGVGHGLFCLGCCWALMLVMIAAGSAVLWWMAALTAVMVYEKTGRHGAALARGTGLALITLAGLFVIGSVLVGAAGVPHHH
jgi:predicted metal-binding membrane protein